MTDWRDAIDAVGKITWSGGLASGTYLGNGWVLTAAHVADSSTTFNFAIDGSTYASSEMHIYGGWTGAVSDGGDIALIKLSEFVAGAQTSQLYSGATATLLGERAYIAGYGRTGTGETGATGSSGVLHAGENLIEQTGGTPPFFKAYDDTILFFDFDDPTAARDDYRWSADEALAYEYMFAPGDSGGGIFVESDGAYLLVGVNSFLWANDGSPDASYGDVGGFTSVADYADWLDGIIAAQAISGDLNGDGFVGQADLDIVLAEWGNSAPLADPRADVNGDNFVGQFDLDYVLAEWGQGTPPMAPAPEPTMLALLALGGMAVIRHRQVARSNAVKWNRRTGNSGAPGAVPFANSGMAGYGRKDERT